MESVNFDCSSYEQSGKIVTASSSQRVRCARDAEAKAKVISLRSFTMLLEQRGLIPRMLTVRQVDRSRLFHG
jgi:hypothetical protein